MENKTEIKISKTEKISQFVNILYCIKKIFRIYKLQKNTCTYRHNVGRYWTYGAVPARKQSWNGWNQFNILIKFNSL